MGSRNQSITPNQLALLAKDEINFDSAELLSLIVEHWGGPARLAADLRQDYLEAKPGSMTRQRIVEMISRLTVQVTQQGAARPFDPGVMSDEDIYKEAERLLSVVSSRTGMKAPGDSNDAVVQ